MSNKLEESLERDGPKVRVVITNGQSRFVWADVIRILGLSNEAGQKILDRGLARG